MFNNTNVRFSNSAQVIRTVNALRKTYKGNKTQYPLAFKLKVVELAVKGKAEDNPAFHGKRGKFTVEAFLNACGLGTICSDGFNGWIEAYDKLEGNTNIPHNCFSLSQCNLGERYNYSESKGLGELARETSALKRLENSFKLVKVG